MFPKVPAKHPPFRVEPRGFELPTSAVQRRPEESAAVRFTFGECCKYVHFAGGGRFRAAGRRFSDSSEIVREDRDKYEGFNLDSGDELAVPALFCSASIRVGGDESVVNSG
jgi:hypothetical protein